MNLRTVDIRTDAALAEKVRKLYMQSFPKEELLPWWLMRLHARRKGFALTAFLDGDQLCGFTSSIDGENMHFLLYFAVAEDLRGKGYGSAILRLLKEEYGTVVLNIEPFVEDAPNWSAMLKPWAGVEIFPTKDAAKEKYTLFGKSNLEAMQ